jgi:hypothetical protein
MPALRNTNRKKKDAALKGRPYISTNREKEGAAPTALPVLLANFPSPGGLG